MNLAPLTNAPFAIQLHAYAALAAFVLGAVQLAAHEGNDAASRARVHLGRPDADRRHQLVLDSRHAGVGTLELRFTCSPFWR